MKNKKQPKTKWLKQLAALCFMMFALIGRGQTNKYCFPLTGPYTDPPAFNMDVCNVPTDTGGAPCSLKSTTLKLTYKTAGSFPQPLTFNIIVSGNNCSPAKVLQVSPSIFSGGVASFDITGCAPSENYTVQISSVSYGAPHSQIYAKEYDFTIDINGDYKCSKSEPTPNCSSQDFDFFFDYPQIEDQNGNLNPLFCPGQQLVLHVVGMLDNIPSYDWIPPNNGAQSGGITFPASVAGDYTVKLATSFDNDACNVLTTDITIPLGITTTTSIAPYISTICQGNSVTLNASNTVGVNTYQWSGGSNSTSASITVSPSTTTTYDVVTTGSTICPNTPAVATINVHPLPVFSLSASTTTAICLGASVTLSVTPQSGTTFLWSTGSTATTITVTPTQNTAYSVTGTTAYGCSVTESISITVIIPVLSEIGIGSAPTASVSSVYQCAFNNSVAVFTSVNSSSTYNWSLLGNGASYSIIPNTGGSSVSVNLSGQTGTGNVLLTLTTYNTGCPSPPATLTIQPCCTAGTGVVSYNSSQINAGTYTGTYLVTGDLTLNGNVNFNGATLEMNPGARIVAGGNLTLNNTHIYSCTGMWQGIIFTNGVSGDNTPALSITNSLIEDAVYGVSIVNENDLYNSAPYQSIAATHVSASLNNAWFNRCAVGIANNFDPLTPYPLNAVATNYQAGSIATPTNCVFTCRNGVTMAMMTAKNTAGLAALQAGTLHNYLNNNTAYTSFTGIASDASAFPKKTISSCFFDNVMDGILATGSLTVTACTFQYNNLPAASPNYAFVANGNYCKGQSGGNDTPTGAYPFYSLTGTGATRAGAGINFFGSSLSVGGSTASACTFLNADYGIISYSNVNIVSNKFTGTNYAGVYINTLNPYGSYTYLPAGAYIVNNNTFTNHYRQGINALYTNATSSSNLAIENNSFTIANTLYTNNPPAYAALPEAISVTGSALGNANINIVANTISNYELGITALGAYGSYVYENAITLYEDNVNTGNVSHGISLTNCNNSTILYNNISASYAAAAWKYNQSGIITTAGANSSIACNTINGPDVSLECQGSNNASSITNNTLQNATIVNFWLQSNGFVGPQGLPAGGSYPSGFTNANIFTNTGSIANGESPYAAYCSNGSNSIANPSPFYYANVSGQIPTPNTSDFASGGGGIALPLGGIYQLVATASAAATCPTGGGGGRMANPNTTPDFSTNANTSSVTLPTILTGNTPYQIANNTLHFAQFDSVACFGNVHDLYRALLQQGAAYYNADAVLSKFMLSMKGSVHEKLLAADTLLNQGGTDSTQLNAALSHNNAFVAQGPHDRYLQAVNNLLAAHLKQKHGLNAVQIQNLRSIAQLCPYQYGEGVFRARALLRNFDATKYVNVCEQQGAPKIAPASAARTEATDINAIASLTKTNIFPNPNSGSFSISYAGTAKLLDIEVYNTLGALVISQPAMNENGSSVTQITGLPEGVYMVRLNGDGAFIKTERIIVTK